MEEKAIRHIGIIESFDLEHPDWPVIPPEAKGTVRSASDGKLYDLQGSDFKGWSLPLVGVRISFVLFIWNGKVIASDIRREDNNQPA